MHVAVLGAGYAGVTVARLLESASPVAELTVVDERDSHLVQHLVHRVIRAPDLASDLQLPLEDLLEEATVHRASVAGVDPETGRVEFAERSPMAFDLVVVCLGARTDFGSLAGVREHGQPLKRVADAVAIRERFLDVCDHGPSGKRERERAPEHEQDHGTGRVVVGGAGTSGVQVAGELAALRTDRDASVEIQVLEQRDTVVPTFPPAFRRAVRDELEQREVTVRTGTGVAGADADDVRLTDGSKVAYDQLVWTGGITGQAAMGERRPEVPATLRLGDRAFALGDAARVVDANGSAVPATAQAAIAQARTAATNVERLADHRRSGAAGFAPRLDRFRYDPLGWLVSVGDDAVAQLGPTVVRGAPARAIKRTVGLGYLGSRGQVSGVLDSVREHLRL